MTRVMIVDDEILVRVGIRSILNWERYGYSVVCEAGSCREAIACIAVHRPQIIFTDLMMDGMDGFDLIDYCAREHPHIKLVVLSSYNDFDYVRRAMKLGASDYIFKLTVKQEELLKVLDELKGELGAPSTESDSIVLRNISAIKTRLITTGIQQTYTDPEEYLAELASLGLAADFTRPYAILYVSIDGYAGERRRGDFAQLQLLKTSMENIIREVLSARRETEVFGYTAGDLLAVIRADESSLPATVGEDFVTIVEFMRRYLGISVSGGVSDVFTGLAALPEAVAQSAGALASRFYSKLGRLHLPGALPGPNREPRQPPPTEDLSDALAIGDYGQAEAYIQATADCLFTWVGTPPESVRMRLLEIYGIFVRHAEKRGVTLEDIHDPADFSLYDAILHYDFLESILKSFLEFLPRYKTLCGASGTHSRPEILRVQRYVRENLSGELGVEAAAELVGMSKSYFSHLFKKETGMSFVDYVNKTRVARAQELLQDMGLRVGEVAEAVGIQNPNYFSVLFKKVTGVTPGEFRGEL